ncbi:MAG: hypothetical protein NVS9B4_21490 [Candidatus Acidiferrum sp.]
MCAQKNAEAKKVGILVLDDAQSSRTLRQILDSEGWRVRIVTDAALLLSELKTGEWSLVIANVALTGVSSSCFMTLRELASVPREEGGRVRVLYLVPESSGETFVGALESDRQPYVLRPYSLHDLLEKVSDLLFEIGVIATPLRRVRYESGGVRKKKIAANNANTMFASRDSYSYTEEELAEYERQENDASKKRPKFRNLGEPNR